MNNLPKFYGIIPARYASERFNGKPLAMILEKPMFWHVYERARKCPELSQVVIATDDDRIASKAKELNVPVIMTRNDHISGTDRVLEAAEIIGVPERLLLTYRETNPHLTLLCLASLFNPLNHMICM